MRDILKKLIKLSDALAAADENVILVGVREAAAGGSTHVTEIIPDNVR